MAFKLWILTKKLFKLCFLIGFLGGFYYYVCGFMLPQSFNVLYTSLFTYPIYSDTITDNKNYEIFLKHFADQPQKSISVYNLRTSKKLALYLLSQSYRVDIPKAHQQKLRSVAYTMTVYLQKHYPFDVSLMLSKADILIQQKQFVQAYNSILASYEMSRCYAPIMRYRLSLKQNYNVFVADKIESDIKNIQNKNCDN